MTNIPDSTGGTNEAASAYGIAAPGTNEAANYHISVPADTQGGHGFAVAAGTTGAAGDPLTSNAGFNISLLICFVGYCLVIYNFRNYIFLIFNIFRGTANSEKLFGENSRVYDTFLNRTVLLGVFATGIAAVKAVGMAVGPEGLPTVPEWVVPLLPLLLSLAAMAVLLYQYALLTITGWVVMAGGLTSKLIYLKKVLLAVTFMASVPVILMFALASGTAAQTLGWIAAAIWGAAFIFLLLRSYMLFASQKISILLWFLYLCAVEILPVSFLLLSALKMVL